MDHWLIATYKINELRKLENNLITQKFTFYLPKITVKKNNHNFKEELLFPGYIFIKSSIDNYSALSFTKGIKKILKFGKNVSFLNDKEIFKIKTIEKDSKNKPISLKVIVGQKAKIIDGPLKGNLVEICSLPSKKRVDILLSLLGTNRRVNIPIKDLVF
tara:strand:+ start:210 stop:686 length:477 start_codon:yes stop_codon:yes gene_type:complete